MCVCVCSFAPLTGWSIARFQVCFMIGCGLSRNSKTCRCFFFVFLGKIREEEHTKKRMKADLENNHIFQNYLDIFRHLNGFPFDVKAAPEQHSFSNCCYSCMHVSRSFFSPPSYTDYIN
ncbi:hypothetical protein OUZ56_007539 [Daphnia magna]|uniref:Uncharacterized protein n=1 Tax=Daphnia magna TaxID=35525 RepID=A0ABR0AA93_9CRUS|nr:hypothetical protein OUZ56_007539 [Daphnia magna]